MIRSIALAVVAVLMAGCATFGGKIDNSEIESVKKGDEVMATMFASRTLGVSIECPSEKVYEFVSNPENLPNWAKGLGKSIKKQGNDWIADTPQEPLKIRFAEKNDFGISDHYVTTTSGTEVYVPMRVLSNGTGSEVILTLFRQPEMSDEKYVEDMKLVEKDLRTLKKLLEK